MDREEERESYSDGTFTNAGKHLMLVSLLSKDRIISNNGKAFLKELILRRDKRISHILQLFESKETDNKSEFLEKVHDLILEESKSFYDDLFVDTSLEVGKMLSKGDREVQDLNSEKSLIYGEVDYISFYRVLRKIKPEIGWTFYDLGSGTSKALFAARFTQDFGRCIGIEILPSLHRQASKIVSRYETNYKNILATGLDQEVVVCEGSFLEYDWSDGDVVFANSTCFDDKLMDDMSRQAESMRPGSFFITFTKGLTSKKFEVLERKRYRMSWGPATVYIHRRLGLNGRPVGAFRLCTLPSDSIEYDDDIVANGQSISSPSESEDEDEDADEEEEDADVDDENDEDDNEDGEDDDEEDEDSNDDNEDDSNDDDGDDEDDDDDEEEEDEDSTEDDEEADEGTDVNVVMEKVYRDQERERSLKGGNLPPPPYAWRPPQPPASENTYNLRPPPVDLKTRTEAGSARWLDSPQDSELLKRKGMNNHKM